MSAAREAILGNVRKSLGRGELSADAKAALEARLAEPKANVVPLRGQKEAEERIACFVAEAERVYVTHERLGGYDDVAGTVAAYLKENNLPATVRAATDGDMGAIAWDSQPTLTVEHGAAENGDLVSVTSAFSAVAETGTLVLLSSPESPTTLNFLPDVHICVLPVSRIEGTYEAVWSKLRAEHGPGAMPRVVNWITGQSRTADIEQTLLLGAHGPRKLHIILVDG
jgi:L-lactate dehydrogenase complex protein LldG